ncbi:exonuclease subunit SbcD [Shewanella maritima]|uniref:Nuclease SbcCD subunit D n=1 Tax=Shewanella maritima TaxID=2520507 RepID=A0A411PDH3_9GAMM|nr:exonuclease subunit SbcD [Shewanella maritima]QBF81603.1 exonuclease subunit SbcD [Shewanella maritima]
MRILHTSDWHLGQYFYGKSRAAEHQAFMDWLLEQIKLHQVDLLIVAGDIFDTTTPPSYARALYNQFIVDLQQTECQLLILGGNHDSVATLGESQGLLAYLNTHVIPGGFDSPEQHVLSFDKDGEPMALVCALPFLRPRELVTSQAGDSRESKQQKLASAIADYYQQSFDHAQKINAELATPVPIIATGHLTTVGVTSSESVRDIYIGTLDAFNANLFPAADYIALGHIHRSQKVAKTEHIRYSGSPIPLSFDEIGFDERFAQSESSSGKSVLLVSFEQDKLTEVTELDVPLFQPMTVLKGKLADIEASIDKLVQSAAEHNKAQNTWLSIEVEQQDLLSDLQDRIAQLIADKPLEVLQLKRARKPRSQTISDTHNETLSEIKVEDVFERRLALEVFETEDELASRERLRVKFKELVEQVQQETAAPKQDAQEPLQPESQAQSKAEAKA